MRESLSSVRNPLGNTLGSVWLELDLQGSTTLTDQGSARRACRTQAQVVEVAQRLPGEPAQLVMVAFALQLTDNHQRQDHTVLVEARHGLRVGEQHGRVEDIGASSHADSYVGAAPARTGCCR